ncbi:MULTISPECIES: hypothetical protein [Geobacillus]|uniref:MarR family transcriptional regulator n=1 Tax=Geobacillus zalihae TaxID=213419 RepID=A0A7H1RRP1_9BACL|nr:MULTISPECIES: hypothetical protein [Geobacillus]EPR29725.1 hypothetical protein I656_00624 [Geobacillus sp. WSUCF1]OQP14198.1 MarR family transcriptional regulator [Geobacillus zalihae]OQP20143.1 MarR family transcriptional regulator [Geobacillus zalihae]QNU16930.1 MarR family transcriptional regulator [Geobacillus zalihae]
MKTLKERIIQLLQEHSGLTDREITNRILGEKKPQQPVNQACRSLEAQGVLKRVKRQDGLIGNYLATDQHVVDYFQNKGKKDLEEDKKAFSEDNIKQVLISYLHADGWNTRVAWGKNRGIDIDATRETDRWIIEVKGMGSYQQMNVNYFLTILGEILQRMEDPYAKYSIALPDIQQFRNLWDRLPLLAKVRTGITALFVDENGEVTEVT